MQRFFSHTHTPKKSSEFVLARHLGPVCRLNKWQKLEVAGGGISNIFKLLYVMEDIV